MRCKLKWIVLFINFDHQKKKLSLNLLFMCTSILFNTSPVYCFFFFCWRKSNKFWINKLSPETKDYHRCIKSSLANKHVMLLSPDQLFTFSESYWFSFGNCATTWKTNKLLTQSNQTDGQMDWEQGCRVFLKHSLFLYTLLWLSYFFFNWPLTSFRSFHFSRISSSTPQNVSNVQRCIEVNWLLSLQFGNASNGDWKLMCW